MSKPVSICWLLCSIAATPNFSGCFFSGPSRVAAPAWNVDKITDGCLDQCDANGDGFVSQSESKNAPGLRYAFRPLDTDQDKQLSRDEIRQRFQALVDSRTGIQGFNCYVMLNNGRPLPDAHVRLVPEPFLEQFIEAAEGDIVNDRTGMVEVDMPGDDFFGVRPGMYRVEITSPSIKIGKKYNEETTLGVEIAPFTNPFQEQGGIKFRVGK